MIIWMMDIINNREELSEEAKRTIEIADELSDMILFHRRVRRNGEAMMVPWDEGE